MAKLIIDNIETNYEINEEGIIHNNKTNRDLKGHIENTGYISVNLSINGKKKNYSLHRLVAKTFIPNPANLPIVNHKDGNKTNNNIYNLEQVSASENRQHAINTKISKLAIGERQIIESDFLNENQKQYKDTSYMVSNNGEVYNKKTKCLLKQTPNQSGYIRYTLRINNQNVSRQAHILVMEVQGDKEILSGQVINHIDGNKINNNINNLEIVSKQENMLHACYILNKNIKPVIRLLNNGMKEEFESISEAARKMKVTPGAITYALKNNSKCCNSYQQYK